jgi:cyclic pyranopterin phosphate synthase
MHLIYTDGSCLGNPGPGGWAAIITVDQGKKQALSGHEENTTNNRMEILAVVKGLEAIPKGAEATVFSDSQYVVNTMTRHWKRNANKDLWAALDAVVSQRRVQWKWVRGHAGDPGNIEADTLAKKQIALPSAIGVSTVETRSGRPDSALTHLDAHGRAQMVDISLKPETHRVAVAKGTVFMKPETLARILDRRIEKGEVFSAARVAAINAAKHTWELIPLCHQIPLSQVTLDLESDEDQSSVHITATVRVAARTGAEMEALTAVSVAGLTIYDMCKAIDRGMQIHNIRLVRKSGGRSGDILLEK